MVKEINSDASRDKEVSIMKKIFFEILNMVPSAIVSDIVAKLADNARTNNHKKKPEKIRERANVKAKSRTNSVINCSKHQKMIKFSLEVGPLKMKLIIR